MIVVDRDDPDTIGIVFLDWIDGWKLFPKPNSKQHNRNHFDSNHLGYILSFSFGGKGVCVEGGKLRDGEIDGSYWKKKEKPRSRNNFCLNCLCEIYKYIYIYIGVPQFTKGNQLVLGRPWWLSFFRLVIFVCLIPFSFFSLLVEVVGTQLINVLVIGKIS